MTYFNRTVIVERDSRALTLQVLNMIDQFDEVMTGVGDVETARDQAVQAAEDAVSVTNAVRVPPYQAFANRMEAEAASVPDDLTHINVAGQFFRHEFSATALITADGKTWTPAGAVTPFHFGAVPGDMGINNEAAFNAMSDWLRTQYSSGAGCFLKRDLAQYERAVTDAVRVKLTENQFGALVSFTYNLGPGNLRSSTLLRKLNAGDYAGAAGEFGKWVKAGGRTLNGLVRRRAAERALFEKPDAIPVLRRGATGPAVGDLQRLLGIAQDGVFGPATQAALIAHQKAHQLLADGIVGPATWASLERN